MSDVDRLLREYIEEHRSGGAADPLDYLTRVEGADRRELAVLIDGYLMRAPREPWDSTSEQSPVASATIDQLARAFGGASGQWPLILPQLRNRAKLLRSDIANRLADALGVGDRSDKVAFYYHEMEQGLLPAKGVSSGVLEALGAILGVSADALRQAGEAATGSLPASGTASAAFARTAIADEEQAGGAPSAAAPPRSPGVEPLDDVDRLFRGDG